MQLCQCIERRSPASDEFVNRLLNQKEIESGTYKRSAVMRTTVALQWSLNGCIVCLEAEGIYNRPVGLSWLSGSGIDACH